MTARDPQAKPPTPREFARLHEVKRAVFLYLKNGNAPAPGEAEALATFGRRLERADKAARDWDDSKMLRATLAAATDRDGNPIFDSDEVVRTLEAMRFLHDMLRLHIDIVKKVARASLPGPTGHQEPPLRSLVFALSQQWQARGGHPGFSSRPTKNPDLAAGTAAAFTGPFLNAVIAAVRRGVETLNLPRALIPSSADIAKEIRALRREGQLASRKGD